LAHTGPQGARPPGCVRRPARRGNAPQRAQGGKKAQILALLERSDGATLKQLMATTGWQAHSVRGFISGALKNKMGLKVESYKRDDPGAGLSDQGPVNTQARVFSRRASFARRLFCFGSGAPYEPPPAV